MHAGAGTLGQGIDVSAGDLALLEDVSLEADAVLRGAHGVKNGGVEGGTVSEDLDRAGEAHRGVGERFEDFKEGVGIIGGEFLATDSIL